MIINIHCFGQIRSQTKERIVEVTSSDQATITEVLNAFIKMYGEVMERLLYNEGKLRDFYSIQVDKKHVKNEELNDYFLRDGQTIAIIPFIAGG
ncbi:MAG: MoaD/ThiS family protein [Candidatus Heimdallarchaeota archaeon]|nr:MoaD/ThiS family protein [Candidatus Heimdallarchaeota archaeon]